jgi:single-strand DNA-binding protein
MTDINRVFLVGRLTRDAELKFTTGGTPVTKFSLALNRNKKNGDQWEEEVNYFDIVLWGKSAENLTKYLVKGKQVAIDGELRQNRWEQEGQNRSKVEIHASNVQLLGGAGQSSGSQGDSQAGGGHSYEKKQPKPAPADNYGKDADDPGQFDDDGIPF